jgi:Ion channel
MLFNLLLGLPTMIVCLLLQALLLIAAVRFYDRSEYRLNTPSILSQMIIVASVMLILVIGNLLQIAIWAVLFGFLGEFQEFAEAFYHSAVNFATLGYGDVVMSARHKLLGPLEAINGVLMIGVSTAALMAAFQDSMRKTLRAREQERSEPST